MTIDNFIGEFQHVNDYLHTATNDTSMSAERRAGIRVVAGDWMQRLMRQANPKQRLWVWDCYPHIAEVYDRR